MGKPVNIGGVYYDDGLPVSIPVTTDAVVLASGSRTTIQTQAAQTNPGYRGIRVVADITTVGTGSITVAIEAQDPASLKWVTVLASAALASNQTKTLLVFPGAIAAANAVANDVLPKTWRINVTHNNANPIVYSVGAQLLA